MRDDVFEKGNVGLNPTDAEFAEHTMRSTQGVFVGLPTCNHLHQHRIIKRRNHGARVTHPAIESHAETAGGTIGENSSVVGHKLVFRILRGDTALDGVSIAGHIGLLRHTHLG